MPQLPHLRPAEVASLLGVSTTQLRNHRAIPGEYRTKGGQRRYRDSSEFRRYVAEHRDWRAAAQKRSLIRRKIARVSRSLPKDLRRAENWLIRHGDDVDKMTIDEVTNRLSGMASIVEYFDRIRAALAQKRGRQPTH